MSTFLRIPVDVWIGIAAAVLFLPGLGAVHLFDRDEINFAEIAREMLVTGDWSRPRIGFQPFYEKPPLFMWLQATSMAVFGVTEFAARFPNVVCGLITLLVLYHVGTRRRGQAFGLLWVLAYLGSILPHLYFRSGIIDPWFNLFIFLGLNAFIRCAEDAAARQAALCGLFLGLAVLTKGPVGVVIPGACVAAYWILRKFRPPISGRHLLVILAAMLGTILPWIVVDLSRNGPGFLLEFLRTHVELFSGARTAHPGFFGYHVVVVLLGCFAASLFAVQEMLKPSAGDARQRDFRRWMLILLWAVLIVFSLVQTKIVHYSSLAYFPLTYLAALQLERIVVRQEPFGATRVAVGVIGALLALVAIAVPLLMMNTALIAPLVGADPVVREALQARVPWTGAEALAGSVAPGRAGDCPPAPPAPRLRAERDRPLCGHRAVRADRALFLRRQHRSAFAARGGGVFPGAAGRAVLRAHPELQDLRALVLRATDGGGAGRPRAAARPDRPTGVPRDQDHRRPGDHGSHDLP